MLQFVTILVSLLPAPHKLETPEQRASQLRTCHHQIGLWSCLDCYMVEEGLAHCIQYHSWAAGLRLYKVTDCDPRSNLVIKFPPLMWCCSLTLLIIKNRNKMYCFVGHRDISIFNAIMTVQCFYLNSCFYSRKSLNSEDHYFYKMNNYLLN